MDVFEIYEELWRRAAAKGAWVHYYTWFEWLSSDEPSLTHDPKGATGWFRANADEDDAQPMIEIYRLDCDDESTTPSRNRGPEGAHHPPPDLEHELITLAHEYGHLMSYRGRTPRPEWNAYDALAHRRDAIIDAVVKAMPDNLSPEERNDRIRQALRDGFTDDERRCMVDEEALAWKVGREVLLDLGVKDFRRFDERERLGLHTHRYRLGIEEASPEDDLASLPSE